MGLTARHIGEQKLHEDDASTFRACHRSVRPNALDFASDRVAPAGAVLADASRPLLTRLDAVCHAIARDRVQKRGGAQEASNFACAAPMTSRLGMKRHSNKRVCGICRQIQAPGAQRCASAAGHWRIVDVPDSAVRARCGPEHVLCRTSHIRWWHARLGPCAFHRLQAALVCRCRRRRPCRGHCGFPALQRMS